MILRPGLFAYGAPIVKRCDVQRGKVRAKEGTWHCIARGAGGGGRRRSPGWRWRAVRSRRWYITRWLLVQLSGCDFFLGRIEPPIRTTQTQTSSLFGSGALTSCQTEPRQTGNGPTEENNRGAERAKSGVIHQPAHSLSTKCSEMTMDMRVRSLFVPAQI